jgi:hypothetical protein
MSWVQCLAESLHSLGGLHKTGFFNLCLPAKCWMCMHYRWRIWKLRSTFLIYSPFPKLYIHANTPVFLGPLNTIESLLDCSIAPTDITFIPLCGDLKYVILKHASKSQYNSPPLLRPLSSMATSYPARFQMYCTTKLSPTREANALIRPLFQCRCGDLIAWGLLYRYLLVL